MVRPKANPVGSSSKNPVPEPPEVAAQAEWLSLEPPMAFSCPYCSRAFRSAQALGGHQNSHREEKKEERRRTKAKKARQARHKTVISPEPVRMIFPYAVQQNVPWHFPQYDPDHKPVRVMMMHEALVGIHMDRNVMKLEEGAQKLVPPGQAPRGLPRKSEEPSSSSSQSSSIGSGSGLMNIELDLELKL